MALFLNGIKFCNLKLSKRGIFTYKCLLNKSKDKNASKTGSSGTEYSKSVLLPSTQFALRINANKRVEHDLWIHKETGFDSLYSWQNSQPRDEKFTLHDGPPYANGNPHMGHALNKILKDITVRFQLLQGKCIHYIPGWDCHGLPIELKALGKDFNKKSKSMGPLLIREKARKFALEAIENQKREFRRWGVLAEWEGSCYRTFEPDYVVKQSEAFYDLFEKGLVYRDYKPVYWSPSSRTALAEAELEYNPNHESLSSYIRFPVLTSSLPEALKPHINSEPVYLLIWTTTPWTLPANQAICYNPEKQYSLISTSLGNGKQTWIVASELRGYLEQVLQTKLQVLTEFEGQTLSSMVYTNPLKPDEELPVISGDHVTMSKGTGLVHTAPAHGPEDFVAAIKHGISAKCLVDENGCYTEAAGSELAGKYVLGEGQDQVVRLLGSSIIHQEKIQHSYPYDWRTKLPVILRASLQWFINTDKLKLQALEAMKEVTVIPSNQESSMLSQLAKRPFWCISRQRVWGVPIPVFYLDEECCQPFVNKETVSRLNSLIRERGTDVWWKLSAEELLGPELIEKFNINTKTLRKGSDIFDIWFDSGMSWKCVLPENEQADLYLEGIDQFGGWFQSSLLTSVALTGKAPYRKIFVHGFVLDDKGQKMSKSLGNVVDPRDVTDGAKNQPALGADVLRWWTASHVTTNASNVPISNSLLKLVAEEVQKMRSVFRFMLGCLHGTDPANLANTELDRLEIIDKFALHSLAQFVDNVIAAYSDMNYKRATMLIGNFVTNQISAFYCSLVKDRLYCQSVGSPERLAAVYVIDQLLTNLTRSVAPVLPHLAEEVEFFHPFRKGNGGVFRSGKLESLDKFRNHPAAEIMDEALKLRENVNQILASVNTKEWSVQIEANPSFYELLKNFQREETSIFSPLCELLQVSEVNLTPFQSREDLIDETSGKVWDKTVIFDSQGPVHVKVRKSAHQQCPRCRRYTSCSSGCLCLSCSQVLKQQ